VICKVISKAFAFRLGLVANRIIIPTYTAFIKGRFFPEQSFVLLDIVHEMKAKKM
jgi:hypothetical protein